MKEGHLTLSLEGGATRDVTVRISPTELFSAISDPPGPINSAEVARYEIAENRTSDGYRFQLFVCLNGGGRTLFYAGVSQGDLALLLDEFEASIPDVPRSRAKA